MKQFVLTTKSESGDNYMYFIKHTKEPTTKQLHKFLKKHASDKDDDGMYENIQDIEEIVESDFLTIPK